MADEDANHQALKDLMGFQDDVSDAKVEWENEHDEERKREKEELLNNARQRRDQQIDYIKSFPHIVVKEPSEVTYANGRGLGTRFKIHWDILQAEMDLGMSVRVDGSRNIREDIEDQIDSLGLELV